MASHEIDQSAFDEATRRGTMDRTLSPVPMSVRFDRSSGRVIVEFENGAAFMVPARLLQGLSGATDDEIGEVELLGQTGLHWDRLDVDFTIAGLMQGVFGTAKFMQAAGQRGGRSKSAAKVAASRTNGAKGGRPKKAN